MKLILISFSNNYKLVIWQTFYMNTIDNFNGSSYFHPVDGERQRKILQLKKPVYSKRLKQKKSKKLFPSSQFIQLHQRRHSFKTVEKYEQNKQQKKVKRSKSDLLIRKCNQSYIKRISQTIQIGNFIKQEDHKNNSQNNENFKFNGNKDMFKMDFSQNLQKNLKVNLGEKRNVIKNYYQKLIKTHQNFFKQPNLQKQQIEVNCKHIQKIQYNKNTKKYGSNNNQKASSFEQKQRQIQKFKLIELVKSQDIQDMLINELSQLRKKRNSLDGESKCLQNVKKQSLIRKNSLFLMNYLKQKQKQQKDSKNQPHINYMKNTASHIKIKQNLSLKRLMQNRINQKIVIKNKINQQMKEKSNLIFNSIKIQPW